MTDVKTEDVRFFVFGKLKKNCVAETKFIFFLRLKYAKLSSSNRRDDEVYSSNNVNDKAYDSTASSIAWRNRKK